MRGLATPVLCRCLSELAVHMLMITHPLLSLPRCLCKAPCNTMVRQCSLGYNPSGLIGARGCSPQESPALTHITGCPSSHMIIMLGGAMRVACPWSPPYLAPWAHTLLCGGDHGHIPRYVVQELWHTRVAPLISQMATFDQACTLTPTPTPTLIATNCDPPRDAELTVYTAKGEQVYIPVTCMYP